MSDVQVMAAIIVAAVVLFVWNRLPVVIVAAGTGLALWATGLLTLQQALAGYGDPAVVFIAALFVVSAALERTGVTAWAGQALIAGAGEDSRTRLLVLIGLLVAVLTALISVNGAVAALLPVVVVMAVRLKRYPSQLLMPLVFSAHAGSLLALTGTPVNVLVADAAADAGLAPFGFFSFTIVGVPLLLGTLAIIVLFGERLLPSRGGPSMPADFSTHARTLVEQYGLTQGMYRLMVREGSPLAGRPAVAAEPTPGLRLVTIQQGDTGGRLRRPVLAAGDHLIVSGEAEAAAEWAAAQGLDFRPERAAGDLKDTLFSRASGLAEVMIPPRSAMIGETVFPGMITESGDLVVIAVQRAGQDLGDGPVTLRQGDTLLLQGTWRALEVRLADPQVVVVNSPDVVRRQAVPLGVGAWQTIAVLVAMVFFLATGLLPPAAVGLLCVFALVLSGVMTVEGTYRAINWTTVILVAALMPLSTAMVQTGAAELLAERLIAMVGDSGPRVLLAGLFILTAILGQLISNTATALIIIPIGVAAATAIGVSPLPVLMSIAVAAAASFLTPIATPTNLMVMGPGGYAFGDYWKLGLPLMIWFGIVAVFLVPLVWPF
ncbi:MAG: SLC13 family permease [Rubritepida sp.]|nr:SLC13 family permease [Rubritepida sp.]